MAEIIPLVDAELAVGVDLYWLPLGAGGHSVRLNGRLFEAIVALREGRTRCDLYHSALVVCLPEGRFVIEQGPAGRRDSERGAVTEGAVGSSVGWASSAVPLRGAVLARRCHSGRRPKRSTAHDA